MTERERHAADLPELAKVPRRTVAKRIKSSTNRLGDAHS